MKKANDLNPHSTQSKQPNRFLSSDETRPIEGSRTSKRSDISIDVGPGSEKTSGLREGDATRINDGSISSGPTAQTSELSKDEDEEDHGYEHGNDQENQMSKNNETIHLPSMFAAGLAPESAENLERLLNKGRDVLLETKAYVKENPGEAAGLIACSGAILWALLGTKPGRRLVEYGTPVLSRYLATGFNQTFALQGRQLQ